MPRHKRVTTCRKSGGPLSKHCSCEHCCLDVCSVCGGAEGSLTTHCPGTKIDADRHQELCETHLDYTETRGWHLADPTRRRSPSFERKDSAVGDPPPPTDPRALIAPSIDWSTVDRTADLQRELAGKAIAWVIADRASEEHSAALARIEDEVDAQMADGNAPADLGGLLAKLESAKIDFRLADQRAQKHDDEFRQTARRIVAALEEPRGMAARTIVASLTNPYAIPLEDDR
jgi:hypothetical protein